MRPGDQEPPAVWLVILGGVVTFAVLLGVWIALVGQVDEQDLVGGSCPLHQPLGQVAAAAAVAVGFVVSRNGRALPRLRRCDLSKICRFPAALVVDSAKVFALAARKACGRQVAGGSWVEVPVYIEGDSWRAARRASVDTVLMSVTPGDIVVDLDHRQGTALVHRPGRPGSG